MRDLSEMINDIYDEFVGDEFKDNTKDDFAKLYQIKQTLAGFDMALKDWQCFGKKVLGEIGEDHYLEIIDKVYLEQESEGKNT